MWLLFFPLIKVVIWGSVDYALNLITVNFAFFFSPVRTMLLVYFGFSLALLFAIFSTQEYTFFNCRYSTLMDAKFVCEEPFVSDEGADLNSVFSSVEVSIVE